MERLWPELLTGLTTYKPFNSTHRVLLQKHFDADCQSLTAVFIIDPVWISPLQRLETDTVSGGISSTRRIFLSILLSMINNHNGTVANRTQFSKLHTCCMIEAKIGSNIRMRKKGRAS